MRITATCVGLILLVLTAASAQSLPKAPFAMTITSSSDGALSGSAEVTAGTPVRISITLTNLSNRDITFQFTTPLCDYSVEVRSKSGVLAADTEEKRLADCANRMTGRNIYRVVKPHGSTKDWIEVSEMCDMSQPGEYAVQVMRNAPKEFGSVIVKSNAITIKVIP